MKALLNCLSLLAALTWSGIGLAHDMDLTVEAIDNSLQGQIRYSDNNDAGKHYISITDNTDDSYTSLALQTDTKGTFKVAVAPGHQYKVVAEGDEGHQVMTVVDVPDNRWPPVYIIIAILALLSLIPAWLLRSKSTAEPG